MPLSPERFQAAVAWLAEHLDAGRDVPPLEGPFPEVTVEDGYRLQHALIGRRLAAGEKLSGMKVALTNPVMQKLFGVDEPCAGLLTSGAMRAPGPLAVGAWPQSNVEPEIGFVLGRPLRGPGVTLQQAKAATESVCAAIEVGHLPASLEGLTLPTMLALNTLNGAVVVGERRVPPDGLELAAEQVALEVDGAPYGTGTGTEVMGDPWQPLVWLANAMARYDRGLEPGMVVITGSMLKSPLVRPGQHIRASYSHLGSIDIRFTE